MLSIFYGGDDKNDDKLDLVFRFFDVDGDWKVSKEEFTTVSQYTYNLLGNSGKNTNKNTEIYNINDAWMVRYSREKSHFVSVAVTLSQLHCNHRNI